MFVLKMYVLKMLSTVLTLWLVASLKLCLAELQSCPTSILELDYITEDPDWVMKNLVYTVQIKFQHKGNPVGMKTSGHINFDLEQQNVHDFLNVSNCTIDVPPYGVFWTENSLTGREQRSDPITALGGFSYRNNDIPSIQNFRILGFLPVGDNLILRTLGTYIISVSIPPSENCTFISNGMPLGIDDIEEDATKNDSVVFFQFQPTVPLYAHQVFVSVICVNHLMVVESEDVAKNRTISTFFDRFMWDSKNETVAYLQQQCIGKRIIELLNFYEYKLKVLYPISKFDVLGPNSLLRDSTNSFTDSDFFGVGIFPGGASLMNWRTWRGYISEKQVNITDCQIEDKMFLDMVQMVAKQWIGFFERHKGNKIDPNRLPYIHVLQKALLGKLTRWALNHMNLKTNDDPFSKVDFNNVNSFLQLKLFYLFETLEAILSEAVVESAIIAFFGRLNIGFIVKESHFENIYEDIEESIIAHNKSHILPTNISVESYMLGWLESVSFPVLQISLNANKTQLSASHKGFFPIYTTMSDSIFEQKRKNLWIPVHTLVNGMEMPMVWLPPTINNVHINLTKNLTKFSVLVNPTSKLGLKIVYSDVLTNLTAQQLILNHSVFPTYYRHRLIQDCFMIATDMFSKLDNCFELIRYISQEDEPAIWRLIVDEKSDVQKLRLFFLPSFKLFVHTLMTKALERIGYFSKSSFSSTLGKQEKLGQLLAPLCYSTRNVDCAIHAKQLIMQWMSNSTQNPFDGSTESDITLITCSALNGVDPDNASTMIDFLGNQSSVNETIAVLRPTHQADCNNGTYSLSFALCTGNLELVLACLKECIHDCYIWRLKAKVFKIYIFDRRFVRPIYDMLKSMLNQGEISADRFVKTISFLETAPHPEITDDLEEWLFDNVLEENPVFTQEAVNEITDLIQHLRSASLKYYINERTKPGLDWLKNNGY